jgi:hypothetical protein
VFACEADAGQSALAPFRPLAEPLADMLRPMPYSEIYLPEEEGYHLVATAHTMFVDTIGGDEIETILEHLQSSTAMMRVAQLRVLGGAMARVPVEATAFAHTAEPHHGELSGGLRAARGGRRTPSMGLAGLLRRRNIRSSTGLPRRKRSTRAPSPRPDLSIVVFDSQAPVGEGQGV